MRVHTECRTAPRLEFTAARRPYPGVLRGHTAAPRRLLAVRAVGSANGRNPIALIVPCHRVIGSNKKLTGYAGGLELKAKLLTHEGIEFSR